MRDTFHRDPRVNALIAVRTIREAIERLPDDSTNELAVHRRDEALASIDRLLLAAWAQPVRAHRPSIVSSAAPEPSRAPRPNSLNDALSVPDLAAPSPEEQLGAI